MGQIERKRWSENDRVQDLIKESDSRCLSVEEIGEIRTGYTGYGGLHSNTFGQFFTPQVVTSFVHDMLKIPSYARVLEPSCGAGAFLEGLHTNCDVVAVEMMSEAAKVSELLYPSAKVLRANTLTLLTDVEDSFDYILGNPPFCDVPKSEDYSGFTIAQKGRGRAEWYFLELGLRALKPGGILAYVLPDGVLANSKEKPLRKWLMDNAWVRGVVSLPGETFKHTGTGVKTSVLVLQKKVPNVDLGNYPILMAVCDQIGWDSRGRDTGKCDLPQILGAWQEMYPNGLPTAVGLKFQSCASMRTTDEAVLAPLAAVQPIAADNRWGQMALGL